MPSRVIEHYQRRPIWRQLKALIVLGLTSVASYCSVHGLTLPQIPAAVERNVT
jgi:hypothetical protein